MFKGFKDFLMRGNVVDLAVAVVVGTTFGQVVASHLKGLINPLIAAPGQEVALLTEIRDLLAPREEAI